MVKQIFTIKRKKGMSFEDFKKHYIEVHAPLVKKCFPEMRKYTLNFVLQRGKETPFDAITEIWWDDIDTIIRIAKADTYKNVMTAADDKFMDRASSIIVLTEEFPQK